MVDQSQSRRKTSSSMLYSFGIPYLISSSEFPSSISMGLIRMFQALPTEGELKVWHCPWGETCPLLHNWHFIEQWDARKNWSQQLDRAGWLMQSFVSLVLSSAHTQKGCKAQSSLGSQQQRSTQFMVTESAKWTGSLFGKLRGPPKVPVSSLDPTPAIASSIRSRFEPLSRLTLCARAYVSNYACFSVLWFASRKLLSQSRIAAILKSEPFFSVLSWAPSWLKWHSFAKPIDSFDPSQQSVIDSTARHC